MNPAIAIITFVVSGTVFCYALYKYFQLYKDYGKFKAERATLTNEERKKGYESLTQEQKEKAQVGKFQLLINIIITLPISVLFIYFNSGMLFIVKMLFVLILFHLVGQVTKWMVLKLELHKK